MKVRGHCLVWDHDNPKWLTNDVSLRGSCPNCARPHHNRVAAICRAGLATLLCKSSHLLAAIHRCRTASTCYNVALLLLQFDDSGGKKRDPFATRAAERLGRFVCRGSGRVVGTMDAGGRRVVRGRGTGRCRVRGARQTESPESDAWRAQTPAEVALRMLILKHVRNWSYEVLERE